MHNHVAVPAHDSVHRVVGRRHQNRLEALCTESHLPNLASTAQKENLLSSPNRSANKTNFLGR